MIADERKAQLEALGYFVEDMGSEYGCYFDDQYRWMNNVTLDFQDYGTSSSVEDAWIEADLYEKSL